VLGDLASAQQIYYMQHDAFAETVSDLNEGDVSFALPEGGAYSFYFDVVEDDAAMFADRVSGMYAGGWPEIDSDGNVRKFCHNPAGTTAFCAMAESAGYPNPDGNNGSDDEVIIVDQKK